jgi:hypothetical protein
VVAAAKDAVEWDRRMTADQGSTTPALVRAPIRTVSPVTPPAQRTAATTPATGLADQVEPVLVQLRDWGAAEYRLEPWGDGGRHFRFWCTMPIFDGAAATQLFDAVAAEPRACIERVAADVVEWRAAAMTAMR